jgi:prepilin-type N-terminal cleavage/methylation domain-containing protein
MKIKILDSNTGFSLTELLVGVGIMGIVALAMATMFASSFNDMRSLKESLAMRDLETRTRQILLRPDYASCLLRGRTLDTTVNPATWNPPDRNTSSRLSASGSCDAGRVHGARRNIGSTKRDHR